MPSVPIHYGAIVVAGLVRFAIGFVYFAPPVFGTAVMTMNGLTREQMNDKAIVLRGAAANLLSGFVIAWVLATAVGAAGASTALQGAAVGLLCWLGFTAMTTLASAMWGKRVFTLWALTTVYHLITLGVMGAILAVYV